jgi:hypothetical protein
MTPDDVVAMGIFDKLCDARVARMDELLQRIDTTAFWLGRQFARHELTRDVLNRRMDALCPHLPVDDERWVPVDIAEDVAAEALRRGMGGTR